MTKTQQNIDWVLSSFKLWEKSMNGASKTELHNLRREALGSFAGRGFPTTRDEEWRFTNVAPIARTSFEPVLRYSSEGVTGADIQKFLFGGLQANRLVFINGHFSGELSKLSVLGSMHKVNKL